MLFFILAYAAVWLADHHCLTPLLSLKDLPYPYGHFIPSGYLDYKVSFAVLLYRPIMTIPTFSVTVRRLHDVNKSGWWCCLWVLPFPVAGWFWLIPWLTRPSAQTGGIWTSSARPEYGRSCRGFFPILLINKPYLELLMRNKECCRILQINRVSQPVESYLFWLKNDMPKFFLWSTQMPLSN